MNSIELRSSQDSHLCCLCCCARNYFECKFAVWCVMVQNPYLEMIWEEWAEFRWYYWSLCACFPINSTYVRDAAVVIVNGWRVLNSPSILIWTTACNNYAFYISRHKHWKASFLFFFCSKSVKYEYHNYCSYCCFMTRINWL